MQQEQHLVDEIDLIDILRILWKRKIMILALTLILIVTAGVVSMMLPKIYKITAIVEPAKDAEGKPVELSEAIRENILGGAYDQQLIKKNNLPDEDYPEWQVQIPKGTSLLKVSLESDKPELAVSLLTELLSLVSARIEERLQVEKERIGNEIKLAKISHKGQLENIKLLTAQTRETTEKIGALETARKDALASRSSDAMSVLLYSNEIQSQQIYLNNLQLQLKNAEQNVESAAIAIDNTRLKLSQIKSTNINKYPTIPKRPIKPKKVLIVALVGIGSLMGSVVLAFIVEFIWNARRRIDTVIE